MAGRYLVGALRSLLRSETMGSFGIDVDAQVQKLVDAILAPKGRQKIASGASPW